MAYARGVVAGYEIDSIDDLILFADAFGASRLREACVKYKELWKKKHGDGLWMAELAAVKAYAPADMSLLGSSEIILTNEGAALSLNGTDSMPSENKGTLALGFVQATEQDYEKEKLNERIAKLSVGVAVIQFGAQIETERKEMKLRVEDALNATKRRVQELESCRESADTETRMTTTKRKKPEDEDERASANCMNSKRKGSAVNVGEDEPANTGFAGLTDNLRISSFCNQVVIEIRCAWREGIFLEIMDVISDLNLDSHSVQSSIGDGLLCLTVNCKHQGTKIATIGMIKEALQRVAWIC